MELMLFLRQNFLFLFTKTLWENRAINYSWVNKANMLFEDMHLIRNHEVIPSVSVMVYSFSLTSVQAKFWLYICVNRKCCVQIHVNTQMLTCKCSGSHLESTLSAQKLANQEAKPMLPFLTE